MTDRQVFELREYKTLSLSTSEIREEDGERLWRQYKDKINVDFPSPKTDQEWRLTPQGWVGFIPLSADLGFSLRPKVPLANLFRMLEYAYRLKFNELEGLHHSGSIPEFYERLAHILAKRILDQARQGLYRTYIPEANSLPYLRGSLDLNRRLRQPWATRLPCNFQEHTVDIVENQILVSALQVIARSGQCTERVLPTVRRAVRALKGTVSSSVFHPRDCVGRLYNRLNQPYQPMHALCRFFLEHSGPSGNSGDREMLPFLVNMNQLFERFVAEWLKVHLPDGYLMRAQEGISFGTHSKIRFQIDMVIFDKGGEALAVLDTKYKAPKSPSEADVQQAIAYAESKGCRQAFLIYPKPFKRPLDVEVGRIRVRSVVFDVGQEVEEGGQAFLEQVGFSVFNSINAHTPKQKPVGRPGSSQ